MMRIIISCFFVLLIVWSCSTPVKKSSTETPSNQDTLIVLRNDSVTLSISRFGGAIVDFHFNNQKLNPLDWKVLPKNMPENNKQGAPFQGHFLCVGRWGSPTEGEKAAGIPHNGEPSNNWWEADLNSNTNFATMQTEAPLEHWKVERSIHFSASEACFEVQETLTNLLPTGRFTAIVQHATLGGAFLDESVLVNSNAGAGFNQALISKSLSEFEYHWALAYSDSLKNTIDLTKSNHPNGYVSTHVIGGEIGWATAANPAKGLLIGYVWKTTDYPWLHIWHGIKDGKLWAKGLEFGTTGLGDTFSPEKRAALTFHGRNNNLFVDAKSSVTKKYVCFLMRIPESFSGVNSIRFDMKQITINYLAGEKLPPETKVIKM
jgi:hypothetical protein